MALTIVKHYLWVVLRVTSMKSNRLEVQTTIEIDGGDDVPFKHVKLCCTEAFKAAGNTHCSVGTIPKGLFELAAGVAGVTPLASVPCFSPCAFICCPSSLRPPGKDSDAGEVNCLACWAVAGCEVRESMMICCTEKKKVCDFVPSLSDDER